jgi:hypothetical protein
LVSVFNTINNCKQDVEQKIGETYKNYKNRDYDKI